MSQSKLQSLITVTRFLRLVITCPLHKWCQFAVKHSHILKCLQNLRKVEKRGPEPPATHNNRPHHCHTTVQGWSNFSQTGLDHVQGNVQKQDHGWLNQNPVYQHGVRLRFGTVLLPPDIPAVVSHEQKFILLMFRASSSHNKESSHDEFLTLTNSVPMDPALLRK